MDRNRVVHDLGQPRFDQLVFFGAKFFEPTLAARRTVIGAPGRRLRDGGEARADVADESERDVAVLADRRVRHVDLHDRRRLEPLAVAHAEVERRPDDHDHVGFVERVRARQLEVVRIAGRQRTAPGAVHEGRDVELLAELDRRIGAARRPNLRAEQDARPLRLDQDVGEFLDCGRVADRLRRGPIVAGLGKDRFRELDFAVEDVAPDLEIRRTVRAVVTFAECHRAHVGDPLGRQHARREFGDRLHQLDVRKILQRTHLVLAQRALPADEQHRALGAERVGDAGDGVGGAGAGRHDRAAGFSGNARIPVGGVRRDLLVTDVDDLDALIDAAVVDVDDVAAAERPNHVDALVFEGLRHQVSARNLLGGRVEFRQFADSGHSLCHAHSSSNSDAAGCRRHRGMHYTRRRERFLCPLG